MDKYKEQAVRFLKNNHLAAVGTISKTGEPQVAVLIYSMDDDLNFYFVTRRYTRKCLNLEANNKVGIAITSNGNSPETVQVQGEYELIKESSKEFANRLNQWVDMSTLYYGSFLKVTSSEFWIFKVKTNWLRYMDVKDGGEEYHQVIPEARA
jgi:general stress protein 26